MTEAEVFAGATIMGAVSGLRSMSSPALISQFAHSGLLSLDGSPIGFLSHPAAAKTTAVLAIGELVADKLPFMPSRTDPPSLVTRAVSGGLAGAAICSAKKRPLLAGALLGVLGAVSATYGAYQLRRWAGKRFHLPDPVVAVAEDAVVAGSGLLVLSRMRC